MYWQTMTIGIWNCEKGFSKKTKRLQGLLRREKLVDVWLLQGVPSVEALCGDIEPDWGVIAPDELARFQNTDTVILYREDRFVLVEEEHEADHYGEYNWLRVPRIRYKQTAVLRAVDSRESVELAVGNIHTSSRMEASDQVEKYINWVEKQHKEKKNRVYVVGGSWGQRYFSSVWGGPFWQKMKMVFAHVEALQVTGYEDAVSNMPVISRREVPVPRGNRAIVIRYKVNKIDNQFVSTWG